MDNRIPAFSRQGYEEVLRNAKNLGYQFIRFDQRKEFESIDGQFCLMRHDIDTSLKCALEMAKIEHSLGVVSTFFFMLRSPAYNLFSRYAFEVLRDIKAMGHEIALHFDAAHPAVEENKTVDEVGKELRILSSLVEAPISTVSFHQPSASILKGDLIIPGVVNTYHKEQMAGWYYCSDSNRIWKEHNAYSVFDIGKYKKIQILIHPIWWMCEDEIIEDAWDHAVRDNLYIMQEQFLATEAAYGAKRDYVIHRQEG
jgi:hypothetical protein